MAIQISGTTVIDNSRVLQNVGGLKTVGGTSILGSGDIAIPTPSTAYDAVGTYAGVTFAVQSGTREDENTTWAGSLLVSASGGTTIVSGTTPLSGTWRFMAPMASDGGGKFSLGVTAPVAVRIA